jgi:hypothetical protein
VTLRAGPLVQYLHLTGITNLKLTGDYGSLEEVAAMPRLRRLTLTANGLLRDLGPLAACPTLRTLELSGAELLQDLSPLDGTPIEELALYLVRADLGTLRARRLRHLRIRDPRLKDGLTVLPAHLPLRTLTIHNLPTSRNLLGIDQWRELEHLAITGVPRAEEVQALASLPRLRHLTVRQPQSAPDLARLQPLASLRHLDLDEVPTAQAGLLQEAAQQALPTVQVRVNGRLAAPQRAADAVL